MFTQPKEVNALYREQQRNPPPAVKSMQGCGPPNTWDVHIIDKSTRAGAWLIRRCDRYLKRCALLVVWVRSMYPKARSFVMAHTGGFISSNEIELRRKVCNATCEWHTVHTDGRDYCRATSGCGCGHWAASALDWRLRLVSFDCPAGKFDAIGYLKSKTDFEFECACHRKITKVKPT